MNNSRLKEIFHGGAKLTGLECVAIILVVIVGVIPLVALYISLENKSSSVISVQKTSPTSVSAPSATTQKVDNTSAAMGQATVLMEKLASSKTLSEALYFSTPFMDDSENGELDAGSQMIGNWAISHLKWEHLESISDNRRADVIKDHTAYRGKKLCVRGNIAQIFTKRLSGSTYYEGKMAVADLSAINYVAVGSSNNIVELTPVRFCGIFTGLFVYKALNNDSVQALTLIGMFDIPENHR